MKPSIVQKYKDVKLKSSESVAVTCFNTFDRYTSCPNPNNENLMEKLHLRHKSGWSTVVAIIFVPQNVMEDINSWSSTN